MYMYWHYDWHWSRKPTCYQIKVHCNSHNAYQQSHEVAYDKHNIKHDHICTCKHIHLWLGMPGPYIDTVIPLFYLFTEAYIYNMYL